MPSNFFLSIRHCFRPQCLEWRLGSHAIQCHAPHNQEIKKPISNPHSWLQLVKNSWLEAWPLPNLCLHGSRTATNYLAQYEATDVCEQLISWLVDLTRFHAGRLPPNLKPPPKAHKIQLVLTGAGFQAHMNLSSAYNRWWSNLSPPFSRCPLPIWTIK